MKKYHEGDKKYACNKCKAHFNSDHHLANHLQKIHSRQESSKFKRCLCKPCNLYFDRPSGLRVHEKSQKHKLQVMASKNQSIYGKKSIANKQKAENHHEIANIEDVHENYARAQDFIATEFI